MHLASRRAAALAVAVAAVASASCSSGGRSATTATSTTHRAPSTTTAPAEPDCRPTVAAGDSEQTVRSGGVDRHVLLSVPPPGGRHPLILDFHGFSSNAIQQAIYSGLPKGGSAAGYVVATPDGLGSPQRWDLFRRDGGDVGFVQDLIADLTARACVDPTRVYAAGISNGSAFASVLACALGDRIAAVGMVAATVQPLVCTRSTRPSVVAFHGTDDPLVPYAGGSVGSAGPFGGLPVQPAQEAIAAWAAYDGCDSAHPADDRRAVDVVRRTFAGCRGGAAVELYTIEGGGHTWPGAVPIAQLGRTTTSIDATAVLLAFFSAHRRAAR